MQGLAQFCMRDGVHRSIAGARLPQQPPCNSAARRPQACSSSNLRRSPCSAPRFVPPSAPPVRGPRGFRLSLLLGTWPAIIILGITPGVPESPGEYVKGSSSHLQPLVAKRTPRLAGVSPHGTFLPGSSSKVAAAAAQDLALLAAHHASHGGAPATLVAVGSLTGPLAGLYPANGRPAPSAGPPQPWRCAATRAPAHGRLGQGLGRGAAGAKGWRLRGAGAWCQRQLRACKPVACASLPFPGPAPPALGCRPHFSHLPSRHPLAKPQPACCNGTGGATPSRHCRRSEVSAVQPLALGGSGPCLAADAPPPTGCWIGQAPTRQKADRCERVCLHFLASAAACVLQSARSKSPCSSNLTLAHSMAPGPAR